MLSIQQRFSIHSNTALPTRTATTDATAAELEKKLGPQADKLKEQLGKQIGGDAAGKVGDQLKGLFNR